MARQPSLTKARRRFAEELRVLLRRDRHDADESCWLHGDGRCLSRRELH